MKKSNAFVAAVLVSSFVLHGIASAQIPIAPSRQPTQPGRQPFQPSRQPVQPSRQPVQPSRQPVQPSRQPVQASRQPFQPNRQPVTAPQIAPQPVLKQGGAVQVGTGRFQVVVIPGGGFQFQYGTGAGPWQNKGSWSKQAGGAFGQGQRVEVSTSEELVQAIWDAEEGTVIWLNKGRYRLDQPLHVEKSILLAGKSRDFTDTQIEYGGNDGYCLLVDFGQPSFFGLKFSYHGKGDANSACVYIREASPTFTHCAIDASASTGVRIDRRDTNPTFKNCRIADCFQFCVHVSSNAKGTFEDCEISDNPNTSGVVFHIASDGNPTVRNSKIYKGKQYGLNIDGGKGTFENVEIFDNASAGVVVRNGADPLFKNCNIYRNAVNSGGTFGGVTVMSGAKGTFDNCTVYENKYGYLVFDANTDPRVIGGNASKNRVDGIYVFTDARGTFTNVTVESNSVGYRMNNRGKPTINGGAVRDTKGYSAIIIENTSGGTFDGVRIEKNSDRGFSVYTGSTPLINNCTITKNGGTGIGVSRTGNATPGSSPGNPTVRNCTITDNRGYGIIVWAGGAGTYGPDNRLSGNTPSDGKNGNVVTIDAASKTAGARIVN